MSSRHRVANGAVLPRNAPDCPVSAAGPLDSFGLRKAVELTIRDGVSLNRSALSIHLVTDCSDVSMAPGIHDTENRLAIAPFIELQAQRVVAAESPLLEAAVHVAP